MSKMTLTEAVNSGEIKNVVSVVNEALKEYNADMPSEPLINTITSGRTPFSVLDEDSQMETIEMVVRELAMKIHGMNPESGTFDKDIDVLIATNPYLRYAGSKITGTSRF